MKRFARKKGFDERKSLCLHGGFPRDHQGSFPKKTRYSYSKKSRSIPVSLFYTLLCSALAVLVSPVSQGAISVPGFPIPLYCQGFDELQPGDHLRTRYQGWILENTTDTLIVVDGVAGSFLSPPNGIIAGDPTLPSVTRAFPPERSREVRVSFGLLGPVSSTVTLYAYDADGRLLSSHSKTLEPGSGESHRTSVFGDIHKVEFSGVGPSGENNVFFDELCYRPGNLHPSCLVKLSAAELGDGDLLQIDLLQIKNPFSDRMPVEARLWLTSPSGIVSLYNAGADNSVVLPPNNQEIELGPVSLFTVSSELERGTWAVGCRLVDPETGFTLDESVKNFVLIME